MILNIICYIITGIVAIDLLVSLIVTLCNTFNNTFYGIERTIIFVRRKFIFGECYITPSIAFDLYRFNNEDDSSTFGIEFCINWLWFGVYISFTKSQK